MTAAARPSERWLPVLALIYLVLYFSFYPATYAFRDESNYLGIAYALRQGTLFLENLNLPINSMYTPEGGRWVSYFPLGVSVLLLPLTFFGWKAAFLLGPIFHLLGTFFTARLARHFGIPVLAAAALYLFFPSFIFFSRTIMSDIPAAAFFLGAAYFYFTGKSRLACGLFAGLAVYCRYSHALLAMTLAAGILAESVRARSLKPLLLFAAGMAPFAACILIQNQLCFGNPLTSGYSPQVSRQAQLSPDYFLRNLCHYLPGLVLVYPGMLPVFLFSNKMRRPEIIASFLLIFALYSLNMAYDTFPGHPAITLVFGNRYLFPVIPFMILAYAELYGELSERFGRTIKIVAGAGLILMVFAAGFLSKQHQEALAKQWAMTQMIYDSTSESATVFYEANVAELLQGVWGNRRYVRYLDDRQALAALRKADFSRGVFLAKRDLVLNGQLLDRGPEDVAEMMASYDVEKIAEKHGAMVYRILPKKGLLS
jgi:hypothetical protein